MDYDFGNVCGNFFPLLFLSLVRSSSLFRSLVHSFGDSRSDYLLNSHSEDDSNKENMRIV